MIILSTPFHTKGEDKAIFTKLFEPATTVTVAVPEKTWLKLEIDSQSVEEEKVLLKSLAFQKETLLLIGPEGDFSKEEIKLALENGFQPISLGESRLRTETAGLVACTTVNLGYEA